MKAAFLADFGLVAALTLFLALHVPAHDPCAKDEILMDRRGDISTPVTL